jgi:hypothetical protein
MCFVAAAFDTPLFSYASVKMNGMSIFLEVASEYVFDTAKANRP